MVDVCADHNALHCKLNLSDEAPGRGGGKEDRSLGADSVLHLFNRIIVEGFPVELL